jgi:hypothetical protein
VAQDYLTNPFAVKQQPSAPAPLTAPQTEPLKPLYSIFKQHEDIDYNPEDALKTGLGMVADLKASLKKLELGSKLRKDVWMCEITEYVFASVRFSQRS